MITSVRQIINPRFNLSTPLISGLFYIAPGVGFFVGSVVGGRLSDRTVKKYIAKRDGVRLPEDRLNSGLIGMFVVLPISMLLYAWGLEKGVGGLALPIVAAFWIGVGLMGSFNSLNTYTAGEQVPIHSLYHKDRFYEITVWSTRGLPVGKGRGHLQQVCYPVHL